LLQNDEIKWIAYDAAIKGAPAEETMSRIRQTNYWRTHSPESRNFDALLATDKAQADRLINSTRMEIDQAYQRQGISKTHDQLDQLTLGYIRGGWTPQDLERSLANEMGSALDNGTGIPTGRSAADADTFLAMARDQGLPLSRLSAEKWALDVAAGSATEDTIRARVQGLARGRWQNDPEVLAHIEAGGTADEYFAIHRDTIADILELAPDSIDLFNDGKYAAITQTYDPVAKQKRSMTIGEVAQWARNQDAYKGTRQYKQQDATYQTALLHEFGAVA
jgi:hypothetical protein